jgi:hypothetical protein
VKCGELRIVLIDDHDVVGTGLLVLVKRQVLPGFLSARAFA